MNIPATFATLRAESAAEHAFPRALGRAFERNGTVVAAVAALALTLVLVLTVALQDPAVLWSAQTGTGAFFRVIPYGLMVGLASLTFGWALVSTMPPSMISAWRRLTTGLLTAESANVHLLRVSQPIWSARRV